MNKTQIVLAVCVFFLAGAIVASSAESTSMHFLTKGRADKLYCSITGGCGGASGAGNCSESGSCQSIAYMDYSNTGDLEISGSAIAKSGYYGNTAIIPNATFGIRQTDDYANAMFVRTDYDAPVFTAYNLDGIASQYIIFVMVGDNPADKAFGASVLGESAGRFLFTVNGNMEWGSGAAARDTNLYRDGANKLRTNDSFVSWGHIGVGYGTPESAYPITVTDNTINRSIYASYNIIAQDYEYLSPFSQSTEEEAYNNILGITGTDGQLDKSTVPAYATSDVIDPIDGKIKKSTSMGMMISDLIKSIQYMDEDNQMLKTELCKKDISYAFCG